MLTIRINKNNRLCIRYYFANNQRTTNYYFSTLNNSINMILFEPNIHDNRNLANIKIRVLKTNLDCN